MEEASAEDVIAAGARDGEAMGMAFKGETGTSLGGRIEKSPAREKREREKRAREQKRWAKKCSRVTSRQLTPEEREDLGLPPC